MKIYVLDKGFVELIGYLGDDLTVVNAARVSFGKEKKELEEKDKILMRYLVDNKHYSPFRHNILQLRISAPEYVLRQLYKHIVGIETSSAYPTKDHAWSELSLRYRPIREYHAQWEIREYAKAISEIVKQVFPETFKVWFRNKE